MFITIQTPSSSVIRFLSLHQYQDQDKLLILFKNGSLYEYFDPSISYAGLFSEAIKVIEKGGSIGAFFNQHKAKLQTFRRVCDTF